MRREHAQSHGPDIMPGRFIVPEEWASDACYVLTANEVAWLFEAAAAVQGLCLQLVERSVQAEAMAIFGIPDAFAGSIRTSWRNCEPAVLGRMDFIFDGVRPPKLLEYNTDMTGLFADTALFMPQWQAQHAGVQPVESRLAEMVAATWRSIAAAHNVPQPVYFACLQDNPFHYRDASLVRALCDQAGMRTAGIDLSLIGYDQKANVFLDLDNRRIESLFLHYPWEWILNEPFGQALLAGGLRLFEPVWKILMSSKAILPALYEMFPDNPHILPAAHKAPGAWASGFVEKPVFGFLGSGVSINTPGFQEGEKPDPPVPTIFQAYEAPADCDGYHPVFSVWIAGNEPAAICIREDTRGIITGDSRFVPYYMD